MMTRLKVYRDAVHPHAAQQPQAYAYRNLHGDH